MLRSSHVIKDRSIKLTFVKFYKLCDIRCYETNFIDILLKHLVFKISMMHEITIIFTSLTDNCDKFYNQEYQTYSK